MTLLVLLWFGCTSDHALHPQDEVAQALDLEGCISIAPDSLWFGALEVGRGPPRTEVATLSNDCDGDLELRALTLPESAAYRVEPLDGHLVLPGESLELVVTFDPTTHHEGPDELVVESSAGAVSLGLFGDGIAPVLVVEPVTQLPWGPTGCAQEGEITLGNGGSATLEVTGLELAASTSEFALGENRVPLSLEPGEQVAVPLDYLPLDAQADTAWLRIVSNDPARPSAEVAATASGLTEGLTRETFEVREDSVDVLWTLDRSGSTWPSIMAAVYMGSFRDALHEFGIDYHIAVVVEDDGCFLGEPSYVDDSFSASEAEEILWTMSDIYFTLGSYGANTERGFSLAMAALEEDNTQEGGCNEGFLRDEAALVVIHTSDEPEQSAFSWEEYVPWLQGLKDDPGTVRVHAAAGDVPGGCGHASSGYGYWEATVATGGLFLSGCTWGGGGDSVEMHVIGMELFAEASLMRDRSIRPSMEPVPETLEVEVDGLTIDDWEWDPSTGLVSLDDEILPIPGATVEIVYRALGECEA